MNIRFDASCANVFIFNIPLLYLGFIVHTKAFTLGAFSVVIFAYRQGGDREKIH